jgi:hypothetical protein
LMERASIKGYRQNWARHMLITGVQSYANGIFSNAMALALKFRTGRQIAEAT